MAAGELGRRVAVAAVGVPAVLLLVWFGGWPLAVLAALAAGVGAAEFYRLAQRQGQRPFALMGVVASMAVVLWAAARPVPWEAAPGAVLILLSVGLLALGASVWWRWPAGKPLEAVSVTVTGVVYVGVGLAFIPVLRAVPVSSPRAGVEGGRWVEAAFLLLPLVVTWVGDTAAYFAGRTWGRTKLAPTVSPGKTVVGAVAGLGGAGAAAVAVLWWAGGSLTAMPLPPLTALLAGFVLGAAGQVGDLAVSVLKRQAGVKDSGSIFPGHGGVLDRVDALLFAFPVAWLLLLAAGIVAPPVP